MRGIDAHCAQAITLHYKRAKQEVREPDFRWGETAAHVQPDFPTLGSQSPAEAPQQQCAAAAMMHGSSMAASGSWEGGCPSIAEHQEWCPPVPQQHVILPNPGGPQPADDIVDLNRNASMENKRELQRYSEKLQFEATCVSLWANGIQDQIMDEQEKVQNWISSMTDEINRLRRVQPAWIHQLQSPGSQQPLMPGIRSSTSDRNR